jgi:hypothetical protein
MTVRGAAARFERNRQGVRVSTSRTPASHRATRSSYRTRSLCEADTVPDSAAARARHDCRRATPFASSEEPLDARTRVPFAIGDTPWRPVELGDSPRESTITWQCLPSRPRQARTTVTCPDFRSSRSVCQLQLARRNSRTQRQRASGSRRVRPAQHRWTSYSVERSRDVGALHKELVAARDGARFGIGWEGVRRAALTISHPSVRAVSAGRA